ncbi:hypothetical protein TrVE_jg7794 [Triparma verrucosa]|uniref:Uncharacterized protein n=1 Tax=Triparma verrucosa TaxID=1606542 RepID=A0A9W7EPI7_9STRA|nr:hypothetical protein TrVE_jg7794 [Triparma verrucosa]
MTTKQEAIKLYREGKYEEALNAFTSVLPSVPPGRPSAEILSNMSACSLHLSSPSSALTHAVSSVKSDPSWPKSHTRLAECYSKLGQSNDAARAAMNAVRLDPGNEPAKAILKRELRRSGNNQQQTNSTNNNDINTEATEERHRSSQNNPPPPPSPASPVPSASSPSSWRMWLSSIILKISALDISSGIFWGFCFILPLYLMYKGMSVDGGVVGGGDGYEEYRRRREEEMNGYSYNEGGGSGEGERRYHSYEQARRRTETWGSGGSGIGEWSSWIMLAGVLVGARVFGVSPWNLMMLVNMLQGRGGIYVGGGGFGGLGGFGGRRRPRGGFGGWF